MKVTEMKKAVNFPNLYCAYYMRTLTHTQILYFLCITPVIISSMHAKTDSGALPLLYWIKLSKSAL